MPTYSEYLELDALLTTLTAALRKRVVDKPPFVNPPTGYDAKGAHCRRLGAGPRDQSRDDAVTDRRRCSGFHC